MDRVPLGIESPLPESTSTPRPALPEMTLPSLRAGAPNLGARTVVDVDALLQVGDGRELDSFWPM